LENDKLKGQLHFSCLKHCLYKFVQCCRLQWFRCIQSMHYIRNGILSLPCCVNGTYEYIAIWTSKHCIQQWMPCNVVPTIKIMVAPYLWIELCILSITCLDTLTLDYFNKYVHNLWYDGGFVIGSKFKGYFHNFYECWVWHNIEGDVRLIKESCPLLVQILFFNWIQSFGQWNLLKGLNVVISRSGWKHVKVYN
jgi:hypothetical protein